MRVRAIETEEKEEEIEQGEMTLARAHAAPIYPISLAQPNTQTYLAIFFKVEGKNTEGGTMTEDRERDRVMLRI